MKFRMLAAVAAVALAAVPASSALAKPAVPVRPSHFAAVTACPEITVTDTAPVFGWFYRTTHTVCAQAIGGYDCIKTDRINPAAVPSTVVVAPEFCLYSRLR